MPAAHIRASLDHVGAIVSDLAAGATRWERLGFALSPISRQSGKMPDRDEPGPWATANRCTIFAGGYLELIGVVDAACFNPWTRFLGRFEGIHLLALRVPDADIAYAALAVRTETLNPPVQRERRLDVDGQERIMRFRNIFSRDEHYPEGRYIVLEHQTPEYLWQPRYQHHPNGALSLQSAMICADDALAQAARLETLIGVPAQPGPDGVQLLHPCDGGSIEVHPTEAFVSRFGAAPAQRPCFAGVQVRFANPAHAARLMTDNGVEVKTCGDERFVGAEHTNGFILRMSN